MKNEESIKIVFLHGLVASKNSFKYLEKEFYDYQTMSFDLIGFGDEVKPKINYNLDDYMKFLDIKLQLSQNNDIKYVLVGHSFGALLAKEIAKKYPQKVLKIFLLGYPFLDNNKVLVKQKSMAKFYAKGAWWTKVMCEMRKIFQILFIPFIFLFRYKYRKAYIDYFKHTYQSAYGTLINVAFKDNKKDLFKLSEKIVFINGQKEKTADLKFAKKFKNYLIKSMGHVFFNYEREIANIIKSELALNVPPITDSKDFNKNNENMAHLKIKYVKWISFPLHRFRAVTLPPFGIFIKEQYKGNTKIIEHDYIHWQQYKKMGLFKYYLRWIWEQIYYGYDKSPMEIEARFNEDEKTKYNYSKKYFKNNLSLKQKKLKGRIL